MLGTVDGDRVKRSRSLVINPEVGIYSWILFRSLSDFCTK